MGPQKPESEFADLLNTMLVSNRQDGLVAEVARAAEVSESLVYRWCQGKDEPRQRHLRAVVKVLCRRGRREEAGVLLDAMLLDAGARGVLLPATDADGSRSEVDWLTEAGEHVMRALREATGAPARALQKKAHVLSAARALQTVLSAGV